MSEISRAYYDIYQNFAATEYGESLENSIRFEKYNTGGLSNEEWCDLLGEDANNLYHMRVTCSVAERFIEHQNAHGKTPIERGATDLILLSAVIHDQGEAITGDISYGDKKPSDELHEMIAFENHVEIMNPNMDTLTKSMAKSAIRGVIFDTSTPEGELFNAIERTGYLMTTLEVAKNINDINNPIVAKGLNWLVADVLLNQIKPLVEYTKIYSLPYELLASNAALIHRLFADIPDETFSQYEEEADEKQRQFIKAQQQWQDFCLQHGL